MSELEKRLEQHGRDKESLQRTKARLCRVSGDHASLSWQHQVLEQRFDQVRPAPAPVTAHTAPSLLQPFVISLKPY